MSTTHALETPAPNVAQLDAYIKKGWLAFQAISPVHTWTIFHYLLYDDASKFHML
jgi:hypothetical protein